MTRSAGPGPACLPQTGVQQVDQRRRPRSSAPPQTPGEARSARIRARSGPPEFLPQTRAQRQRRPPRSCGHRSSHHGLWFPAADAVSVPAGAFLLGRGRFHPAVLRPASSPPQVLCVPGELPAKSGARFRAAFRSRSIWPPPASHWTTRSSSLISGLTYPQATQVLVDG